MYEEAPVAGFGIDGNGTTFRRVSDRVVEKIVQGPLQKLGISPHGDSVGVFGKSNLNPLRVGGPEGQGNRLLDNGRWHQAYQFNRQSNTAGTRHRHDVVQYRFGPINSDSGRPQESLMTDVFVLERAFLQKFHEVLHGDDWGFDV